MKIACGSENDLPQVALACAAPKEMPQDVSAKVLVMSCHRNPEKVRSLARGYSADYNVVIGVGGKAARAKASPVGR